MTRKQPFVQGKRPYRKGFTAMSGLISNKVKRAGESRGFAVMRLLTHWKEIVGEDLSTMAHPVNVSYSRDGFGATLTVLCKGATAPIVQTMLPQIKDRVNACYGYSAISRVRITQTAPIGFAEGQMNFESKSQWAPKEISEDVKHAAREVAGNVGNEDLRQALEKLAQNVLSRNAR
ncbi:MAG: DciA family protein [Litoreibacter sp.]